MENKRQFEIGQDVYIVPPSRNENEPYYIAAKVLASPHMGKVMYICRAHSDSKLYYALEKEVFATRQEAEDYCKKYTMMNSINKLPKIELTDFEKLKIAYEVIRDLETRNDIRAGVVNSITVVKNILANDIAFDVTFRKE